MKQLRGALRKNLMNVEWRGGPLKYFLFVHGVFFKHLGYESFGSLLFGLKGSLSDLFFLRVPSNQCSWKNTWNGHCLSISWKKSWNLELLHRSLLTPSHFVFHKQYLDEDKTWTMESHALGGTCGDESGMMRWSFEAYCKTPLISTYVFSGLATVQVLIFGGRTYFRGVW